MSPDIISKKEKIIMGRNRFTNAIYLATLLLMLVALFLSWQRTEMFELERATAANHDREVWLNQGERNPHSAAHFSRYAFKPIPSLSAFEPGAIDYSGLAIWMEAHRRNPATFRYAEGAGELANFVSLTPAWIMQAIIPLVIILLLFPSYAGEREDGTLRQLLSHGISLRAISNGKIRAALYTILKLLLPLSFLIFCATILAEAGASQLDQLLRLILLFCVYGFYFMIFAFIAIGVSAKTSNRRSSAITLFTLWFFFIVVAPKLTNDLATYTVPQPKGFDVNQSLSEARGAYSKDKEYQEEKRQEILDQYGVVDVNELPVNYRGYALQTNEEYGDLLYDQVYNQLGKTYKKQENVLGVLSVLSPTTVLKQLSAGLAGTDRLHHDVFAWEAELHRRYIIKMMNEDLMFNAVDGGNYSAGKELWSQVIDYQGQMPSFMSLISSYISMFGILTLWAFLAFLFARHSTLKIHNL